MATNGANYAFELTATSLNLNYTASAVPEPSTDAMLFGLATLGFTVWRRRKSHAHAA